MSWESFGQWWSSIFKQIGNWFLSYNEGEINNLTKIILAVVFIIIGHFIIKLIIHILKRSMRIGDKLQVDVSVKSFSIAVIRVMLYIILVFIVFAILGIPVTGLAGIASAATVALGLALQDLIGAFFSGIVLLRTKYFKTGDYISINHSNGTCEGSVKRINIFSTTLTTFDNQVIIINNSKLLNAVITNFNDNTTRRLVLSVDVDYDTDTIKCKEVLRNIIESEDRILSDPKPDIHVDTLGEYSITMKIKCYTLNTNYWPVRNSIYETILIKFRENNIKIPFRRLVVEEYHKTEEDN